jgi:succinate-semialdehyde dehydrogenase / glutarate-semialdehyde dehydrogenase
MSSAASNPVSHYAVTNPATGERVREYATIADEALMDTVAHADAAHRGWARSATVAERAALMRRVGELHTERRDALAAIIVREMGKPVAQALGEIDFCSAIYSYYADNAETLLADEPITLSGGDGSAFVRRSSVGVLLGIMPWNFPYYQVARFAGPNLCVGNTILLKHAPQCPESAAAIQQMFDDAGVPMGAYNNIYASNDQVATLIADPRVQGVSVTGSERAGAAVAEIAGRNLKKVVLELGGSDPFVLLSTNDLDAVVDAAVAARIDNAGQACNAAKRFVVTADLYDLFVAKLGAALTAIAPSDPALDDTAMGPLSSSSATDRLMDQVGRAVAGGAKLVGGERNGNFVSPGLLTGMTKDNEVYGDELFGPIAIVYKADSEDAAIEIANDTPYGLGSYVFTTDAAQALRVADRIEAGMVFVNVVGADAPELPFGGVKRSGFGRELGRYATEEFVNRKMIRLG